MRNMLKYLSICFTVMLTLMTSCMMMAAQDKLTVILDWLPNPNHGPLVIAKELGYFKAAGLDVTLIGPTDPSDPPKWVAAKKADVAITYQPQFMQYVDHGLPLIRIGTLIDKPLNCLIALKQPNMTQLNDLKGKRIGSSLNGLSHVLLSKLLKNADINENDITLVQVKYNLNQALLTHRVDAVSGMMRNVEIPQLEALGHEVVAFFPEEHGVPTYNELIYVAHLDRQHDPKLQQFIAATEKGAHYIAEHPKEAWQLFTKAYPALQSSINQQIWFHTISYFDETPSDFNQEEWGKFADFLFHHHLITVKQPISRYAVRL